MSRANGAVTAMPTQIVRDVPIRRATGRAIAAPATAPIPTAATSNPTVPGDTCTDRTRNATMIDSKPA